MALDLKLEDLFTFKQGEIKKRDKIILSLYKKGKLTIEEIAEATEVSVEYVKELLRKSS
jgi:DNA-directed RNA polymerase specialized sigma subunit